MNAKNQQGFLTIVAVVLVLLFGTVVALIVRSFTSSVGTSINDQAYSKAYYLAVTGVESGIYQITQSTSICNGNFQTTQTVSTGQYRFACLPYTATTTLSGNITNTSTALTLTSVAGLGGLGYITVDSELIYYNSVNTSTRTLSGVRRGQNGTTAASHISGAPVTQSEYIITGQGGYPTIASPIGFKAINQAVIYTPASQFAPLFAADPSGQFYQYNAGWATYNTVLNAHYAATKIDNPVYVIFCAGQNLCFAGGQNGQIFIYTGSGWPYNQTGYSTGSGQNILSMFCPTSTTCLAGGGGSVFYKTTNSGGSWSNSTVLASNGSSQNIYSMSCLSTNNCQAVAGVGEIYSYNGTNWSINARGSRPWQDILSVSCVWGGNVCYAVGRAGMVYKYSGGAWDNGTTISGATDINAISCPSATLCVAAGKKTSPNAKFFQFNGTSWSTSLVNGGDDVLEISCASTTNCKASGKDGKFYTFNGSSWSIESTVGNSDIQALSHYTTSSGGGSSGGTIEIITTNY